MKRRLALVAVLSLMLTWLLGVADVAAKSGGGGFRSGGRATREDDQSFGSGSGGSTSDTPAPDAPDEPKRPKKAKSWRSMVRDLLTGGLIGSIFYGRRFGGVGLLEVVVLSGLILLAFWALSRYQVDQTAQLAHAGGYGGGSGVLAPPRADLGPGEVQRADPAIDTDGVADAVARNFSPGAGGVDVARHRAGGGRSDRRDARAARSRVRPPSGVAPDQPRRADHAGPGRRHRRPGRTANGTASRCRSSPAWWTTRPTRSASRCWKAIPSTRSRFRSDGS